MSDTLYGWLMTAVAVELVGVFVALVVIIIGMWCDLRKK